MRLVERTFLRLAVLAAGAIYAQGASALMVSYEWVPGTNSPPNTSLSTGTLTLDSAAITDASNFASIAVGSLVSFSYQWQAGQTFSSAMGGYTVSAASGWSAVNGFLTTVFTISKPLYQLAGQPYNPTFPGFGTSSNNVNAIGALPAEVDAGYWRFTSVSSVPVPAAIWLLVSGIAGFAGLRRRQWATAA